MFGSKENDCVPARSRIQGVSKQDAAIGKNRRILSNIIGNFGATPFVRHKRIGVLKENEYPKPPARKKISTATRVHRPVTRKLSAIIGNIFAASPPCVIHRRGFKDWKNPVLPVHRPVTRKFAAEEKTEKTGKVEHHQNRIKEDHVQHKEAMLEKSGKVEHHHQNENHIVIKEVQHKEAMVEKIDPMEVDMVDDEPVKDIDIAEKKNPLAVTEYVDDIFEHYKRTECVLPKYMAHQTNINGRARGVLIDWLIEIHYKLKMLDETLFLAVNVLDRFLAAQHVSRNNFQLIGVAALVLACKYEEGCGWVINDVISMSDKAFCKQDIIQMENMIVKKLHFNLSVPTPLMFMNRFLRAAKSDKKLEVLSFFLLELCLVEYEMVGFPPSLLAAASIFTAKCTLTRNDKEWSKTLESYTHYSKENLMACAKNMVCLHKKIGSKSNVCSVEKKYSCSFGDFVTNITPAFFLLES